MFHFPLFKINEIYLLPLIIESMNPLQIEVEMVNKAGNFMGTMWESTQSRNNVGVALLEAGLAKIQINFATDKIPEAHLLMQAEQRARKQKLKVCGLC